MANLLSSVVPKLLASLQDRLRANAITARLTNSAFSSIAAAKGSTISVPFPGAATVRDVVPAAVPPASVDITPAEVLVQLDQWKEAEFHLTDKQQLEVMEGFIPRQATAAMSQLIDAIDSTILAAMNIGAGAALGTAGTTPFSTLALALEPLATMGAHLLPNENRHVLMDPFAQANLLTLEPFTNGTFTGDVDAMTAGRLNQRAGMAWWMDQNCPQHVKGAGAGYLVNNAGPYAIGTTSIVLDTGTGQIKAGDVVTFAGDTNKYVVAADLTGAGTLSINAPGLKATLADNVAMTILNTHRANFAFQSDGVVFASRPFVESGTAVYSQQMADPISGISVRLEIMRQHKQDKWSFDAQWGTKVIRPQSVIKVMG